MATTYESAMKRLLFQIISTLLLGITSKAQLKVASYCYGKLQTDQYEHFDFWTKDGKRTDIQYSYGKSNKEVKLQYIGRDQINGASCFKVQFTNKYVLYIIPKGLQLKVTDATGKYNKTFSWEYEGPVNGIGTYCDPCAEDDTAAMKIMLTS